MKSTQSTRRVSVPCYNKNRVQQELFVRNTMFRRDGDVTILASNAVVTCQEAIQVEHKITLAALCRLALVRATVITVAIKHAHKQGLVAEDNNRRPTDQRQETKVREKDWRTRVAADQQI